MKTSIQYALALAAMLVVSQSPGLLAQETPATKDQPMGRTESLHLTVSAEVTALNPATREITLKGADGNEMTVVAGENIKRLDEVKVGDFVRVDYLASVAAEVRKPTEEEAAHPLVIMDVAGRASKEAAPAGGIARRFKVVTTIEALDRRDETVTVKGPLGRYLTVRVADPARLTKVHIGETIVVVYTEAMALSLEKTVK
jgi:hypothetical protein